MMTQANNEKIWDLMKDQKIAMLVTQDNDHMRARPMALVQDSFEGNLWFFTHRHDAKVYEAQEHRQVCVTLSDSREAQLSLSGTANISADLQKKKALWNKMVSAWFEEDVEDPEVVLLEIKITQAELWETTKNKLTQLFEITKAAFTDETPDIGKNRKFG